MKLDRTLIDKLRTQFLARDEYIPRVLYRQTASVTVGGTGSITTLLDSTGALGTSTMPANYLSVGRTIRLQAWGYYSTAVATNLTFATRIAGSAFRNTTNAATTPLTSRGWRVDLLFTCRSTGASGTVHGQGYAQVSTSAAAAALWDMVGTGTFTVDTTASASLNLLVQWSVSNAGNTITCTNVLIEAL